MADQQEPAIGQSAKIKPAAPVDVAAYRAGMEAQISKLKAKSYALNASDEDARTKFNLQCQAGLGNQFLPARTSQERLLSDRQAEIARQAGELKLKIYNLDAKYRFPESKKL